MAGSLHLLLLASSALLGLVSAQNVHCGKKTSKWVEVWGPPGQDGDFWTFRSQRRGKATYLPNTRCAVKYTAGYNCSEINFWCDQMSVKGRRAGNSCVGSYLQVRAAEDGKKQKFCRGMLPNVTSSGPLTVVFRSNKKEAKSGGARCYAECSAPGDPADYEEFVGEERTNLVSEPKRDYHEDWDYWGDSDAMEWGDSEESADRMDAKAERDDHEDWD